MILVLGTGGLLKLPETGYQLYVRPGDVFFFLPTSSYTSSRLTPEPLTPSKRS
jgi:hypothetical protein